MDIETKEYADGSSATGPAPLPDSSPIEQHTAKILQFRGVTRLDLPPDQILEAAKGELDGVLVIGFSKDDELYTASSYADGPTVLWLLEMTKKRLLEAE